jgi:hypothetical protein
MPSQIRFAKIYREYCTLTAEVSNICQGRMWIRVYNGPEVEGWGC